MMTLIHFKFTALIVLFAYTKKQRNFLFLNFFELIQNNAVKFQFKLIKSHFAKYLIFP